MPRRPRVAKINELVEHINKQLDAFSVSYDQINLRQRVEKLVEIRHGSDDLGVSVLHDSIECQRSAKARIEAYLISNVGKKVHGDELAVVSGISEYGRRVRELRVEHGFAIYTGASSDDDAGIDLAADEYMLTKVSPDLEAPRRWHIANRIRKIPGGARNRLLLYFKENVMRIVTTEELRYVAKSNEFPRRIRELRTEEGYPIATFYTGRPDLRPGEYVLLDSERIAEPHDRKITVEVQQEVYQRDENTCRKCMWKPENWTTSDPRILELHHFVEHAAGGKNTTDNLLVLCSRCHDEIHAGRIDLKNV